MKILIALFTLFFAISASATGFSYCEAELNPAHAKTTDGEYLHFIQLYIERSGHSSQQIEENLKRVASSPVPMNPISVARNTRETQLKLAFENAIQKLNEARWTVIQEQLFARISSNRSIQLDRDEKEIETDRIADFHLLHSSQKEYFGGKPAQLTVGDTSYVVVSHRGETNLLMLDLKTGAVKDKNSLVVKFSSHTKTSIFKTDDDHIYVTLGSNKDLYVYKVDAESGLTLHQQIEFPSLLRSLSIVPGNNGNFIGIAWTEPSDKKKKKLWGHEPSTVAMDFNKKTEKFTLRSNLRKVAEARNSDDTFNYKGRLFFLAQKEMTSFTLFEINKSNFSIKEQSPLHFRFYYNNMWQWVHNVGPAQTFEVNGETYLATVLRSEVGMRGRSQLHILRIEEKNERNALGWPIKKVVAISVTHHEFPWARYNRIKLIQKDGRFFFLNTTEKSFELTEFNVTTQKIEVRGSEPAGAEPKYFDTMINDDNRVYMTGYIGSDLTLYEVTLETGEFRLLDQYRNINDKVENGPVFIRGIGRDFVAFVNKKLEILSTTKKLTRANREPNGEKEKDCEEILSPPALSYISMIEIYFESQGAKAKEAILNLILNSKDPINPFARFQTVVESQIGAALDRIMSRVSVSDWDEIRIGLTPLADRRKTQQTQREDKSRATQAILDVVSTYIQPGPILKSTAPTHVTAQGHTFVSYSTFEDKKVHLFELDEVSGILTNHQFFETASTEQHGPVLFKLRNDEARLALGTGDEKILLFQVGKDKKIAFRPIDSFTLGRTAHVLMPLTLNDGRVLLLVDSFKKDQPKERFLTVFEIVTDKLLFRGEVSHSGQLTGRVGLLAPQSRNIEIVVAGGGKWQRFDLDQSSLVPSFNKTIDTHTFEFGVPKRFRSSKEQIELAYFATKDGLTVSSPTELGITDPKVVESKMLGDGTSTSLVQVNGRDIFILRSTGSLTVTELVDKKTTKPLGFVKIDDCFRYIGTFVSYDGRIIITCSDLKKLKIFTFDPSTDTFEFAQQVAGAYERTPFFVVLEKQAYMITQTHETKAPQVFRFYREVKPTREPNSVDEPVSCERELRSTNGNDLVTASFRLIELYVHRLSSDAAEIRRVIQAILASTGPVNPFSGRKTALEVQVSESFEKKIGALTMADWKNIKIKTLNIRDSLMLVKEDQSQKAEQTERLSRLSSLGFTQTQDRNPTQLATINFEGETYGAIGVSREILLLKWSLSSATFDIINQVSAPSLFNQKPVFFIGDDHNLYLTARADDGRHRFYSVDRSVGLIQTHEKKVDVTNERNFLVTTTQSGKNLVVTTHADRLLALLEYVGSKKEILRHDTESLAAPTQGRLTRIRDTAEAMYFVSGPYTDYAFLHKLDFATLKIETLDKVSVGAVAASTGYDTKNSGLGIVFASDTHIINVPVDPVSMTFRKPKKRVVAQARSLNLVEGEKDFLIATTSTGLISVPLLPLQTKMQSLSIGTNNSPPLVYNEQYGRTFVVLYAEDNGPHLVLAEFDHADGDFRFSDSIRLKDSLLVAPTVLASDRGPLLIAPLANGELHTFSTVAVPSREPNSVTEPLLSFTCEENLTRDLARQFLSFIELYIERDQLSAESEQSLLNLIAQSSRPINPIPLSQTTVSAQASTALSALIPKISAQEWASIQGGLINLRQRRNDRAQDSAEKRVSTRRILQMKVSDRVHFVTPDDPNTSYEPTEPSTIEYQGRFFVVAGSYDRRLRLFEIEPVKNKLKLLSVKSTANANIRTRPQFFVADDDLLYVASYSGQYLQIFAIHPKKGLHLVDYKKLDHSPSEEFEIIGRRNKPSLIVAGHGHQKYKTFEFNSRTKKLTEKDEIESPTNVSGYLNLIDVDDEYAHLVLGPTGRGAFDTAYLVRLDLETQKSKIIDETIVGAAGRLTPFKTSTGEGGFVYGVGAFMYYKRIDLLKGTFIKDDEKQIYTNMASPGFVSTGTADYFLAAGKDSVQSKNIMTGEATEPLVLNAASYQPSAAFQTTDSRTLMAALTTGSSGTAINIIDVDPHTGLLLLADSITLDTLSYSRPTILKLPNNQFAALVTTKKAELILVTLYKDLK